MPHVVVIYASRHGGTAGIAERIAEVFRGRALDTELFAANDAPEPVRADGVVLGSAAYMGKWLEDATTYIQRHRETLRTSPTWLFSSGPVGTDMVDKEGHDLLAPPRFLVELAKSIGARGTRVFRGRWDPSDPPMSVGERLFRILPISRDVLPIGDYRDWDAIDSWANEIADELTGAATSAAGRTS
jgi:menaquinone-dependent protoporphyrinogen oxidase